LSAQARVNDTGLSPKAVSTTRCLELTEGWSLCRSKPNEWTTPVDLPDADGGTWLPAIVPGTIASSLGAQDLDHHPDYDASDWWYRCSLRARAPERDGDRVRLRLHGLATLCEVWLNGEVVLESSNMFLEHEVDVTDLILAGDSHELVLVFRSLRQALGQKRPRPRWKTKLIDDQQLRWHRTTLLGRIPGWTPLIPPVGPWRGIEIETISGPALTSLTLGCRIEDGHGVVTVEGTLDQEVEGVTLWVGDVEAEISIEREGRAWAICGQLRIESPKRWWPRTHGDQALYSSRLVLTSEGVTTTVDCGEIGFRSVHIDQTDGRVQFVVNGVPVFSRGACWTSNDIVSLVGSPQEMRNTLRLLADANANMVRVGGTMVYETPDFYRECDRLGLMVWQDFMFANMDYPVDEPAFAASIEAEANQQIGRLSRHPSVVAYCGGSEVEQQAAMFGADRGSWSNDFFSETLPDLIRRRAPESPFWPSTPTGGALPFHLAEGLSHYYGVGAYRRSLDDVRLADVKFSPECLGFSNVPEPDNLRLLAKPGVVPPHHPAWKAGVPRDGGAWWDFEDIRDHYLEQIFSVDAVRLRSEDPDRYMCLSRAVSGRAMAHVFAEWRSPESACGGALVWFLRDLRPGAGWGIIDSSLVPKPVYYYLKRAWAPHRVNVLDRGLDGVRIEIHNDGGEALSGRLEARLFGSHSNVLGEADRSIEVPSRGSMSVSLEEMLGHFADPSNAYRFGPRGLTAVAVKFESDGLADSLETIFWPSLQTPLPSVELAGRLNGSTSSGSVEANGLARDVRVDVKSHVPSENYFDLTPGSTQSFTLRATREDASSIRGFVEASNVPDGHRLATSD
jgi:beta-mannosidase